MSFARPAGLNKRHPQLKEAVVSTTTTKTGAKKVATVIVPVADQDRMIDFYVEKLGLEKRTDIPFGNGYRWVEVAPADAETTIALAPPPEGKPTDRKSTRLNSSHSSIS